MQAVSSANRDVKQSMLSGRSFISIMKRSGPKIVEYRIGVLMAQKEYQDMKLSDSCH